jgi:hypothetical protein
MEQDTREAPTVDLAPSGTETLGLGRRFLARILDAIIIGIPADALLAIIGLPAPTVGAGGTEAWLESAVLPASGSPITSLSRRSRVQRSRGGS